MEYIIPLIMAWFSGLSEGMRDRVSTPGEFKSLELANIKWLRPTRWFNHKIDTWLNKYKYRNPERGPAFFGATTFLVWLTDAWHFFNFLGTLGYLIIIAYLMVLVPAWNISLMILMMLGITIANAIGFYITYTLHKWVEKISPLKTINLNNMNKFNKFIESIFQTKIWMAHVLYVIATLMIAHRAIPPHNEVWAAWASGILAGLYILAAAFYVVPIIPQVVVGIWKSIFKKKPTVPVEPPVDKTGEDEKLDVYKQFADSLAAVNKYRALPAVQTAESPTHGIVLTNIPEGLDSGTVSESESGNVSKDTSTGSEPKPVKKSTRRRTRSTKAGAKKPGNTNQKSTSTSKTQS